MNPYWEPLDDKGEIITTFILPLREQYSYNDNPAYNQLVGSWNKTRYTNIRNSIQLRYNATESFYLLGLLGLTRTFSVSDNFAPPSHAQFAGKIIDQKGRFGRNESEKNQWNVRFNANFTKTLAEKHMLTLNAATEMEEQKEERIMWGATGFASDNVDFPSMALGYGDNAFPSGSEITMRRIALIFSGNYYYDMRYFLDINFNANGSSSFGENSRWAKFYSVGLGWNEYNIDNEVFGNMLDSRFSSCYKIINTLNPMIDACEKNKDKLSEEYRNIVKGEGLAFRACLHLDLIRLWGPMPTQVNTSTEYLPYVSKTSSKNYKYSTFDEYMKLLIADLDEAEKLLQEFDPILKYPADGSTDYTGDWTGRKSHFNYYGVLGLQARARVWMGDREGTLRYTKMVKDAKNEDGTSKFVLATEGNMGNKLFYIEHLCGTSQADFDYQNAANGFSPTQLSYYNENYYTLVTDLFGGNASDIRYKTQWSWNYDLRYPYDRTRRVAVTTKFNDLYPSSTVQKNMPIVRLAEMYLVIMEAGTLDEANTAYKELCIARNVPYVPMTEETRLETVKWEYLREFIVEGQNFFTCKRLAVKRMLWQDKETSDCGEEQYVLPLPPSEYKERK